MAELLRLESTRLYGNNNPRCVWGLFHIFDSYQRREAKRIAAYRRLRSSQYDDDGTDILLANAEAGGEDAVADKGENVVVENKANNMNKSSGKARIMKFIDKKLLRRQKHKGKMSHSSSHMMRTISIHHLESGDYVPQGEFGQMTSDSETSTIALSLDETDSLAISEHESLVINGVDGSVDVKQGALGALNSGKDTGCISQLDELGNHLLDERIILKEKLIEARDALLKQKDSDPKGLTVEFSLRSKIFLDTLQLFNTNREALYNVCKGQNSFLANDIQSSGCPAKASVLKRSVSLTGLELSGNAAGIPIPTHKHMEGNSFVNQGPKSESMDSSQIKTFGVVPDIEVLPCSHELKKQRETKTVLGRLRELKQRIKGIIAENKKEHHRISMDRILDKVPSGHKLLEDLEADKLHLSDGSVSEKYYRGGQGFKFHRVAPGSSISKFAHNCFQRSRSLNESMDRYSQLLESISVNEVRKAPERSNSIRENSGLLYRKLPKTHGRMLSNPEFLRSYSISKDAQRELHHAFQSSKKPTLESLDSALAPTADGSDKLNKDLVMQPAVEEIACEGFLESNFVANAVKAIASDEFIAPNVETSITETTGHKSQPGTVNECLQTASFQSPVVEEKNDLFNEHESQIEDKPSPLSVFDSIIEEEPISPLKFTVPEGSDMQQLHDNLEEQLPGKDLDCNEPNIAELSMPAFYEDTNTTPSSFLTHVDEKDSSRFNYVKHILSKSGYEALLFDTEDSSIEVDTASHLLCDMPSEEQLIHDLINEVLFEIYEHSTAPSSWLPRFHSKIRSMPTGSYLLEQVWAEIRWHLCSKQGLCTTVDNILARNFSKTDGWMNLYRDAECFGLLLEQLILDDLVDEIIFDSDEL